MDGFGDRLGELGFNSEERVLALKALKKPPPMMISGDHGRHSSCPL